MRCCWRNLVQLRPQQAAAASRVGVRVAACSRGCAGVNAPAREAARVKTAKSFSSTPTHGDNRSPRRLRPAAARLGRRRQFLPLHHVREALRRAGARVGAAAQGGGPRAARGVRDGGAGGPGSGDARRAARPRLGRRVRRVDPQRDALGRRARDRHARRALRRRGGRHVVRVDALAAVRRRRPRGAPAVHRAALRPARRRGRRRRAQLRRRRRRRRRRRAAVARAGSARRAKERRVQRLKCAGCGAILADAAAFQLHCGEVDHDDDFTCAAPRAAPRNSSAQVFGAIFRRNYCASSDRAFPHTRAGTTASRSRSC